MRISIIQSALQWEDPAANRHDFSSKMSALRGTTDLIVLPEMFTTGFSMQAAQLAEPMDGPTVQWMQHEARTLNAAITGSFICVENGQYFNRLLWVFPDGRLEKYDKRHLFGLAGEGNYYTSGTQRLLVEWRGWRVCPLVCYDLRFPEWSRNNAHATENSGYELLIYVANWPARRNTHWKSLLTARAIENQAFTVGVNIFGTDGTGLEYTGDSAVIDFGGHTLCRISGQEGVFTTELSLAALQHYRQQLPFLQDGSGFRPF